MKGFHLTREVGSRILRTMHQFHCLLLFTNCSNFAQVVIICFTGQVKSL